MSSGNKSTNLPGRSLCWERGLKCYSRRRPANRDGGRSLCWERGLKSVVPVIENPVRMSLPLLGAWIEMLVPHPSSRA